MSASLSKCQRTIRQLIVFPPATDGCDINGLVRQRHFLFEHEDGAVYQLNVPCNWDTQPAKVATLADVIASHDVASECVNQIASVVGWGSEKRIEFVDFDLSAPDASVWPVRAAAIERCRA